jgi:hypothetical protein
MGIEWRPLFTCAELNARAKGLVSGLIQVDINAEEVAMNEIPHSKATKVSGGCGRAVVRATGMAEHARWLRCGADIC